MTPQRWVRLPILSTLLLLFTACSLLNAKSNGVVIPETDDIVIENGQFRLVIGSDAITKSLVLKATGKECLMPGEPLALFSVTQERPYHNEIKLGHPNKRTTFQADSLYMEGERLIVGFELIPYQAVIGVEVTPAYITFTLEGFLTDNIYPSYLKITPPPATEFTLLQLPVKDQKYFGEWLNVSWDDEVAVNVLAADPFAYIDFERRNGYKVLKASALKEIKWEGTSAALIVSPPGELLDNIAQLEEDFELPKGVKSRRNELINASYYWTGDLCPENLEQHLHYAKMGGFRTMNIYYTSFEKTVGCRHIGNFEIDKGRYPNGVEELKQLLNRIKAAGITPGAHFLPSHIGRSSQYVTPVPDYRLNLVSNFSLARDLGIADSVVYVEQNPRGSTMADGCRVLKAGTELISYEGYTTEPPYKFTGCRRGIDNTTVNSLAKGHSIGILDVSEFGATSVYIDQRTSLQDEVAEKIAAIYNLGFQFFYFDGAEGVNPPFGINVGLGQYRVFKRLDPAPLFAEGAAKSHFSWHMLSGGNAFDVFSPEEIKRQTCRWPLEEAPRMRQDFTRLNFGWLGYFLPSKTTVGTQPDMLEFVTSKAASWDCPISLQSNLKRFEEHPRTADNLEVIRRWEEVRATDWLTEADKEALREGNREYHLLINEQGEYELVEYEPILTAAAGSRELRAFLFNRRGEWYLRYWHIAGNKKLQLPVAPSRATLYKQLRQPEPFLSTSQTEVTVPLNGCHYIKVTGHTKEQIVDIVNHSVILD